MAERSVLEVVDFVVAVGARTQMSVAIDQAGQNRRLREVDHFGARRNLEIGGGGDALDPLILDHDDHVFANVVAGGVKQAAREDVADLGRRLVSRRSGRGLPESDR